ncbi:ATP-binding protein [Actinacidiphila acidipaludis]|uniref:ATP-binding protein n=1 Tax=Actinacidiphila acidipaludis TaxID=2873382 RepID=A0ABS7Q1M0_9ACTN|nr:ATP-binding protein [Streptomyces acidipaludis]MBY8877018.1 ATP-binding protein [Streptomyces acidipaludis]
MSLPLPRRIARAALLLGAAAAPLVGAGAAHAAALPQPNLGGLSTLDGPALGDTVDSASHQTTVLAAEAGTDAMKATLPTTDHLVGTTARTAVPTAQQAVRRAAGNATEAAGRMAGGSAESAAGALPSDALLPAGGLSALLPDTGALPTTDHLPMQGLPVV